MGEKGRDLVVGGGRSLVEEREKGLLVGGGRGPMGEGGKERSHPGMQEDMMARMVGERRAEGTCMTGTEIC